MGGDEAKRIPTLSDYEVKDEHEKAFKDKPQAYFRPKNVLFTD